MTRPLKQISMALTILLLAFSGCSRQELETVQNVDLDSYSGKWYEIALLPNTFEKNCTCTTAEYTPMDKYIRVVNRCYRTNKEKWTDISGKAFPVKGTSNSQLKVQFFWPFKGDYYIMKLADDYSWALVGDPGRKFLWILARNPVIEEELYNELLEFASSKGFDTSKVVKTLHNCE